MILDATREFSTLGLGDRRLDARGRYIAAALQADPSRPFPKVFHASEAALEGFYPLQTTRLSSRRTCSRRTSEPRGAAPHPRRVAW